MRRRALLLAGGAILAGWQGARADGDRPRRLGILIGNRPDDAGAQQRLAALRAGLADLGWAEGRNLHIDERWSAGDLALTRRLAAELVALGPDVIFAPTTPVVAAVLAESRAQNRPENRAVPIVFALVTEPVSSGFVESLAHPGGSATGFTNFDFDIGGKWLQLLHEIDPQISSAGILYNPTTAPYAARFLAQLARVGNSAGVAITPAEVDGDAAIEAAMATIAARGHGSVIALPDLFTASHFTVIVEAAMRRRIPGIYPYRYFAAAGGLVSYGIDASDVFRRSAGYVDRIFRGARPGDLPVQNPTKFELVINLATARALELPMTATLLARADDVID